MPSSLVDTWGQLPAVTLPLPVPSRDTLTGLSTLGTGQTGVVRAADGARWGEWGAARQGARTTLKRSQLAALGALGALLAATLLLTPRGLATAAIALLTLAYL